MLLYILAYLRGALTIASPCILPVMPFAFAGCPKWRPTRLPLVKDSVL
jgi:cytochrome c biogenesis protein CcdA